MTIIRSKAKFNRAFKKANEFTGRYRVLMGGAGSGKSCNVAQDFIIKLMDKKYSGANLLVVRKVDESNRDSTFTELMGAIKRICGRSYSNIWSIKTSPLSLECMATGNKIIFRGMKDASQREKVKSISAENGKLCWIWMEEATEFQEQDIEMLDDRLRGILPENLYYQMTFTFNPVSSSHFLKTRFFENESEDVFVCKTTYKQNAFIDSQYHKRMEQRKERDKEGYRVYALGEWGELGGRIFNNFTISDLAIADELYDDCAIGQDFGFNHANCLLKLGYKDGDIYVLEELYLNNCDTNEIIEKAKGKFSKKLPMYCDSAEPDRIVTWRKAGYMARGVKKENGSVRAQIDWLKGRKIIINSCCKNIIRELQGYSWKFNANISAYIDEPESQNDDAIAALRYGIEGWRRSRRIEF